MPCRSSPRDPDLRLWGAQFYKVNGTQPRSPVRQRRKPCLQRDSQTRSLPPDAVPAVSLGLRASPPGLRHPPAPPPARSPQRLGLPNFPTWPRPELRAWLVAGRAGLPVHTGAPGAGPATSPGEGPDLGREAGGDKKPPGRPGRPVSAALPRRPAQPRPPDPAGELLPVAISCLPLALCLVLSLFLAGGQASRSSEEWGDPMDKPAQSPVGHNLLPHWTSAYVRVVGSRLHEWRELWQAGVCVLGL